MVIITFIVLIEKEANFCQLFAPMVFGMISLKIKMPKVINAAIMVSAEIENRYKSITVSPNT